MIASVLVCVALFAQASEPAADRGSYERVVASAGRDANAHIKIALWCEAHGLDAERLKHLARAVLVDPKNAAARGMMGLVAYRDRWGSPSAISQRVRNDEALGARLAEYEARRAEVDRDVARFLDQRAMAARLAQYKDYPDLREEERRNESALQHKKAARSHVQLALWCERNGLRPEAVAHFTEASLLSPQLITPWEHLGCKKHKGRWMTEAQIAAEQREIEAQRHADRRWEPLLRKWKLWLGEKSRRKESEEHMAHVTDPRAVPSIWRVFAKGDADDQKRAVRLLDGINSPNATRAMVMLAVFGAGEGIRDPAVKALLLRDPRDAILLLIQLIHVPLRYTVEGPPDKGQFVGDMIGALPVVRSYDSFGTLTVEGDRFIERRGYYGPSFIYEFGVPVGVVPRLVKAQIARQRLLEDVLEVNQIIAVGQRINERTLQVLGTISGQDFGDKADLWRKWWAEQQGYVYDPPKSGDKPIYYRTFGHNACFAAGTLVSTLSGPRPIETLKLGDRVLSQDTRTGVLSYQPVLAVHHNPPNQTLRIHTDGEVIVATSIHRFWKAGHGWVMARDLKPGDSLRIVGGTARVDRIEPDTVQPVYNLDVAQDRNFFVGKSGLLVHDFSLVEAVPEPFDAPPSFDGKEGIAEDKAE